MAFKFLHCDKGLRLQIFVLVSWDWLRHHCGSYGSYGDKQSAQKAALNKTLNYKADQMPILLTFKSRNVAAKQDTDF